jgi:hypothetical protein
MMRVTWLTVVHVVVYNGHAPRPQGLESVVRRQGHVGKAAKPAARRQQVAGEWEGGGGGGGR